MKHQEVGVMIDGSVVLIAAGETLAVTQVIDGVEHIGLLPLVMVSPLDWDLIRGGSEERRRLMDQIISQGDRQYLDALIRYNKALEQRNSMIKNDYRDPLLYESVEQVMCSTAALLHESRKRWIEEFTPIFMRYYGTIAGEAEQVRLSYKSHLSEMTMQQLLNANRDRDMIMGYTTRGVHRDDIDLWMGSHPMCKTGSQGQCKTYTIALRLAQFEFLKKYTGTTPILLLDDIFDKLDEQRVVSIVNVVSNSKDFGQIFITDSNKKTLPVALTKFVSPYESAYHKMFPAILIAIIPTIIVYCMFSNQIVDGLTTGAVKG